jgi:hypothetical protein
MNRLPSNLRYVIPALVEDHLNPMWKEYLFNPGTSKDELFRASSTVLASEDDSDIRITAYRQSVTKPLKTSEESIYVDIVLQIAILSGRRWLDLTRYVVHYCSD